jgi:hypothetical protein
MQNLVGLYLNLKFANIDYILGSNRLVFARFSLFYDSTYSVMVVSSYEIIQTTTRV